MYGFKWVDFVTDELLDWVCQAADVDALSESLRPSLVCIIECMGGPPLSEQPLDDAACLKIAKGLVEDSLREAFLGGTRVPCQDGFFAEELDDGLLESELQSVPLVNPNWCSAKELEVLPFIGEVTAQTIVEERMKSGPFSNSSELAKRVPGVGDKIVKALKGCLIFRSSPQKTLTHLTAEELIRRLVQRTCLAPEEGLLKILNHAASKAAKGQKDLWYADRRYDEDLPQLPHHSDCVGILRGGEYYKWLPAALDETQGKICIAMFHMAFPAENHPTKKLLDSLIQAATRGVDVRVLLDRDRSTDPYLSSVINENAAKYLIDGGVKVRFDSEDTLLHSKFVLLDDSMTVMGSHNWSAGSYFQYHDVSVVLESVDLAGQMETRFDGMWGSAE